MNILTKWPQEIKLFIDLSPDVNRHICEYAWDEWIRCAKCCRWVTRHNTACFPTQDLYGVCYRCCNMELYWLHFQATKTQVNALVDSHVHTFAAVRKHYAIPPFCREMLTPCIAMHPTHLMKLYIQDLKDFKRRYNLPDNFFPAHLITYEKVKQNPGINLFGKKPITEFIEELPSVINRKILDMAYQWIYCKKCKKYRTEECKLCKIYEPTQSKIRKELKLMAVVARYENVCPEVKAELIQRIYKYSKCYDMKKYIEPHVYDKRRW